MVGSENTKGGVADYLRFPGSRSDWSDGDLKVARAVGDGLQAISREFQKDVDMEDNFRFSYMLNVLQTRMEANALFEAMTNPGADSLAGWISPVGSGAG